MVYLKNIAKKLKNILRKTENKINILVLRKIKFTSQRF